MQGTGAELKGRRYAILLAVPVTYAEFIAWVDRSDWLAKYRQSENDAESSATMLRHWWDIELWPLVAEPLEQLIACARELGVQVVPRATLADLTAATATNDIVILFAHWKGYEFVYNDLIQPADPLVFRERAQHSSKPLSIWLSEQLAEMTGTAAPDTPWSKVRKMFRPRPPATLIEVLSLAVTVPIDDDEPDHIVDKTLESTLSRLTRQRAALDALLHGLVRPGNRLELFDGLHSEDTVAEAIAPDFHGWLDLTTCTSAVLATHLLRARHNAFRMVQFEKVQEFLWHAHCVRIALRLIERTDLDYASARLIAHGTLNSEVENAVLKQGKDS